MACFRDIASLAGIGDQKAVETETVDTFLKNCFRKFGHDGALINYSLADKIIEDIRQRSVDSMAFVIGTDLLPEAHCFKRMVVTTKGDWNLQSTKRNIFLN
eukprot:568899_1